MTSTATTRLRLNKQGVGDNVNTWGTVLNGQVFDLIDTAIGGVQPIALTGNKTLTSTNYVDDEARNACLLLTDGGLSAAPTITIPSVEKGYFVINDTGYTVTFTAGGTTGAVETGRRKWVWTDGTDVYVGEDGADKEYVDTALNLKLDKAGGTMTGFIVLHAAPTADLHAATKKYVDDELMSVTATAELPGQSGNSGKYLTTDGTNASWSAIDLSAYLTIAAAAAAYQPLDADLTALAALTTTAFGRLSLTQNVRRVTSADSPVTAANGDYIICDSSGGAITINFPAAAANAKIWIKAGLSAETNNVTLTPNGADTILGEASLVIDKNLFAYEFTGTTGDWD